MKLDIGEFYHDDGKACFLILPSGGGHLQAFQHRWKCDGSSLWTWLRLKSHWSREKGIPQTSASLFPSSLSGSGPAHMTCDWSSFWFGLLRMTSIRCKGTMRSPFLPRILDKGSCRVLRSWMASSTVCFGALGGGRVCVVSGTGFLRVSSRLATSSAIPTDCGVERRFPEARLSTPNVTCKLPGFMMIESWRPWIGGDEARRAADISDHLLFKASWWPCETMDLEFNHVHRDTYNW